MDYWILYGATKPMPDPANPPPACIGQVWVRPADARESLVSDMLTEDGTRVPIVFGGACSIWPPVGALLVAGPHAPWRAE